MTDIVEVKKGEFAMELKQEDKKIAFKIGADTAGVDIFLTVDLEIEYFLDKLTELIPGEIDDAIVAVLKASFLK